MYHEEHKKPAEIKNDRMREGEAGCFLSNNLLCLVSFFFVSIFLPITLCIFFSEKKNMNNVNIIT